MLLANRKWAIEQILELLTVYEPIPKIDGSSLLR